MFVQKLGLASTDAKKSVLEKVVGQNTTFLDVAAWRAQLTRAEWRVCRVDLDGSGNGTGFLVGPDTVLTNHHVVATAIGGNRNPNTITCRFTAASHLAGAPGVVHGGIQATVLDETLGMAARTRFGGDEEPSLVTADFQLHYRRPVPLGEPLVVRGELVRVDDRDFHVVGRIESEAGEALTGLDLRAEHARIDKKVSGRGEVLEGREVRLDIRFRRESVRVPNVVGIASGTGETGVAVVVAAGEEEVVAAVGEEVVDKIIMASGNSTSKTLKSRIWIQAGAKTELWPPSPKSSYHLFHSRGLQLEPGLVD